MSATCNEWPLRVCAVTRRRFPVGESRGARVGKRFALGNVFARARAGAMSRDRVVRANRSFQFDFNRESAAVAISTVPAIQGSKSTKLPLVEAIWEGSQHVYNGALWFATRVGVVLLHPDFGSFRC
jgi:hypothetical protein